MNKKFILIITGIMVIFIVAILYLNINKNDENGGNIVNIERTGWAKDIPSNYKTNAKEQGKLEKVEYSSIDYTNNNEITKEAIVYLPFGYDENKKYNIYYLMHGWTGYAGDFFQYSNLKNILDNMIENKDIEPLIVVAATFDAENIGQDWGRSVEELRVFYKDFENHLMPYIESHYSSYAKGVGDNDLVSSRNHRAFGGFSLGGVTTWSMFEHSLKYIKYYLPMSGDSWCIETFGGLYEPVKTVDYLENVVKQNRDYDFFVYSALGTRDARYEQVNNQMVEMLKRDIFKDNFVYYQVKGAYHDMNATDIDMYNGLQTFFQN